MYHHLDCEEIGDALVVRFLDHRILHTNIEEVRQELLRLVERTNRSKILLNFSRVDLLSSAALAMLLTLYKKVAKDRTSLRLSNMRPQILDIFDYTRLNGLFDIDEDEAEALARLQAGMGHVAAAHELTAV
jgi:anti-sigma B factor antagonist